MEKADALRRLRFRFLVLLFSSALAHAVASSGALVRGDTTTAPALVEIIRLDTTIRLDIRYATPNNFTGHAVYPSARAFLRLPAAEALLRVHRALRPRGYRIVVFDAYRPWSVTKTFWDVTPTELRKFVANPVYGSRHNRGCAVDCSLVDTNGNEVPMPTGYDDFSERAGAWYAGGTQEQRTARDLLRSAMEREGFTVNPDEWWHFDYAGWRDYPVLDLPFDRIR
jgi:zinc D-Ala-D-Ala dipeptidase